MGKKEKKKKSGSSSGNRIIIDIGTQTTKILEITSSKKKITIHNVHKLDTSRFIVNRDITNIPSLVEGIAQYLEENEVKAKKVSLMFTCKSLESYFETVPEMTKKELKEYTKTKNSTIFANKTEKSHCIDFATFGDVLTELEGSKSTLLMVSVPKVTVNNVIKEFKRCGYKVDEIDIPLTSQIYLHSLLEYDYENVTKLIVDIGYTTSAIILMHLGVPVAVREFGGVSGVIDAIRKEINIPPGMANDLVMKVGLDKDSLPESAYDIFESLGIEDFDYFEELERSLEMYLVDEISKSVSFFDQSMSMKATKIILVGGGSLIKGLGDYSSQYINIDVESLNIVSSVNTEGFVVTNDSSVIVDGSFGSCLGLAVKGVI